MIVLIYTATANNGADAFSPVRLVRVCDVHHNAGSVGLRPRHYDTVFYVSESVNIESCDQ